MEFGGRSREPVESSDLVGPLARPDVEHQPDFFDAYEMVHRNKLPNDLLSSKFECYDLLSSKLLRVERNPK